ncbi:MAG: hypothetical protein HeimC3_22570 [Candidatus Heimdallarchaeota archaeon LC_3]|nr:MAG: hypothetical protein HeimC3_22570 [Candidatus Heimdallarchaeota archaeon LC_3]
MTNIFEIMRVQYYLIPGIVLYLFLGCYIFLYILISSLNGETIREDSDQTTFVIAMISVYFLGLLMLRKSYTMTKRLENEKGREGDLIRND